jgi:hypothetical protein
MQNARRFFLNPNVRPIVPPHSPYNQLRPPLLDSFASLSFLLSARPYSPSAASSAGSRRDGASSRHVRPISAGSDSGVKLLERFLACAGANLVAG